MDVEFVTAFPAIISLALLRSQLALSDLALLQKGSRLSILPVNPEQWQAILALNAARAESR